jgi:glycosyltransferase involved in cell wall biosynthesis
MESIKDCFHEIHVTDTGSTDGTLDLLEDYKHENPANTTLFVHHFPWVDDFAAARNSSFSHSKADYVMWMDLDDVMSNAKDFINWRDEMMPIADLWVATYHYGGLDENGNSPCNFIRERVVKNNGNFKWRFFVHEGLVPTTPVPAHYALSWSIVHKRTAADQKKDQNRNLAIFESRDNELCARMRYYYGKELFEGGQPLKAYSQLLESSKSKDIEQHDRIMAMQYACAAAMQCNQFDEAIQIAHQGLVIAPTRGEFHIFIADSLVKQGKIAEAVPFFSAAKSCVRPPQERADVIFSHADATGHYPRNQLARCYFHTNRHMEAKEILEEAMTLGTNTETMQLYAEVTRIQKDLTIRDASTYTKTDDIVITCLPNFVKDWDESSLKTRGLGGSETAVIHMARQLAEVTGRKVKVFNERAAVTAFGNVTYEPLPEMYNYLRENMPAVHIAWRHSLRLNPAPMYTWCHDLGFIGMENPTQFDYIMALSEFHQNFLRHMFNIPREKMILISNGIDPARFDSEPSEKQSGKVVFSSSPDRGLDNTIAVMDIVVKEIPDAELHVFYGVEGLRAMNRGELADQLETMMKARPYVKYHGNVTQDKLTEELKTAAVWLYPTNFLETYCITAIEALCSGVYPVVRKFGALPDTLKMAEIAGMASVLDTLDPAEYAREVISAIKESKWRRVNVKPEIYSWKSVAKDWVTKIAPLQ